MDDQLIEELLHEEESSTLDFKEEQYKFEGENDIVKSELLKDILAFANSWKRSDSYILIGVKEVKGSRSEVLGIDHHIDDAQLQQFVNSKTQKPLTFAYKAQHFQGEQIGVIWIPVQTRPVYLKKDYGKLKGNIVYIRRGSATDEAKKPIVICSPIGDCGGKHYTIIRSEGNNPVVSCKSSANCGGVNYVQVRRNGLELVMFCESNGTCNGMSSLDVRKNGLEPIVKCDIKGNCDGITPVQVRQGGMEPVVICSVNNDCK